MNPTSPREPGEEDLPYLNRRFESLVDRFEDFYGVIRNNEKAMQRMAQDAAMNAAIKVAAENARSQTEMKRELVMRQDMDRKGQEILHGKVDVLTRQMNEALGSLNNLASAKLIQLGITGLILAVLITIGFKAIGG